jgi:hypothetical protein
MRMAGEVPRDVRSSRPPSFGPVVAAFIVCVTVFSFAVAAALSGIPDSETGLFYAMGETVGIDLRGVDVVSAGWMWVARLAGLGMLGCLAGVLVVRKRIGRSRRPL